MVGFGLVFIRKKKQKRAYAASNGRSYLLTFSCSTGVVGSTFHFSMWVTIIYYSFNFQWFCKEN